MMSQPTEVIKKKLVCETSYIANEHDYLLKSPIVNNNTIQAGESLPCTNGGCSHPDEQQQQEDEQEAEMECTNGDGGCEETTEVKKEEKEEVGAAKKRKGSTPKKNDLAAQKAISLLPAPHNLR